MSGSFERERGWRIDLIPGKPVRREPVTGRVLVPQWLVRDGKHRADLDLSLSPAEAELLLVQLRWALGRPPQGKGAAHGAG